MKRSLAPRTPGGDESGMVIVLVALAMVVLLTFTALAVDAGNARQIKRQAQTSADLASLSGVLDLSGITANAASDMAKAVADVETYALVNNGVAKAAWVGCDLAVSVPAGWTSPDSANGDNCILVNTAAVAPYTSSPYSMVKITHLPPTAVATAFGRVVGQNTIYVSAHALALRTSARTLSGLGVVALRSTPNCVGVDLRGSVASALQINGGSIIVNCASPPPVSFSGSNPTITGDGTFYSVGSCGSTAAAAEQNCSNSTTSFVAGGYVRIPAPVSDPLAAIPDVTTTSPGVVEEATGANVAGLSCLGAANDTSPTIYYIDTGTITNFPSLCSGDSGGVLFYLAGSSNIALSLHSPEDITPAPTSGPWRGISIFAARGNAAQIDIQGNSSGSLVTGTIYARDGFLTNSRGNINLTVNGQIVVQEISEVGAGGPKNLGIVVNVPTCPSPPPSPLPASCQTAIVPPTTSLVQ